MEDTKVNLQDKSVSSLVEMIGSVILLICLFLPWVTVQLGGRNTFGVSFGTSYSFFDGISQLNTFGNYMPGTNYLAFLYLVPILCIANPIVQYFKRLPWLSYYTAWIPVLVGMILLYGSLEETGKLGNLGGLNIGAGAVLSLIVGLVMQFSAWTAIGVHYKEHQTYFFTVVIWFVVSIGVAFVLGGSVDTDLWLRHPEGCIAWGLFASVGLSHFFFLLYGGIVMAVSPGESKLQSSQPRTTSSEAEEYLNKVRERTDEELKAILQHKEDYNERLVRAAKRVVIERASAPSPAEQSIRPSESAAASITPAVEAEDDKYKAYQPSATVSGTIREKKDDYPPASAKAEDDSFAVFKKEWKQENPRITSPATTATTHEETIPLAAHSSNNNKVVLYSILAGVLIAVGGALAYFLWYVPYTKDRDAPRTYVLANNVFLRSSRMAGVEYNVLGKIPYGTEVITYNKLGDWAEVKVDGQEGVMATPYLLDSLSFALLNGVWGNNEAKECVKSSKCRLAILDYLKSNYLQSGPNGWQLYTRFANQKPNTVFYPRLYDKYSKYTDFVFIISNNETGNRVLVCYSFDDVTEKPKFRFSVGVPQTGYIKNIVTRYKNIRVIFDDNKYINIYPDDDEEEQLLGSNSIIDSRCGRACWLA